jgi:hypothetical protein
MKLRVSTIMLLSLARVVFFPLFLACNTPTHAELHKALIGDWLYFIILLLFGLTNG